MSDKTDVIYDMLKEMASKQGHDRDKASDWREKVSEWTGKTDQRLANLEDDMKIHIEGVVQNRAAIDTLERDVDDRLKPLEEPSIVRKHIKKVILGAGALAAAAAAILKLLDML